MARQVIGHVVADGSGIVGVPSSKGPVFKGASSHPPLNRDPLTGELLDEDDLSVIREGDATKGRISRVIEVVGEEPDESLPSLGRLHLSAKAKAEFEGKVYVEPDRSQEDDDDDDWIHES